MHCMHMLITSLLKFVGPPSKCGLGFSSHDVYQSPNQIISSQKTVYMWGSLENEGVHGSVEL